MQLMGTLKKRKKRNLTKVKGLSSLPYNGSLDTWKLFSHATQDESLPPVLISTLADTRVRMASIMDRGRNRRVTRDPYFHLNDEKFGESIKEVTDDYIELSPLAKLEKEMGLLSSSVAENEEEFLSSTVSYEGERSHFIDKATMNRLKMLLFLGAASGTFPWTWNEKKFCIDKWKPSMEKIWKFQWLFVSIQTIFLTGFQFYSFISRIETETKTYRDVFMNSVSVYWYVCAVYFNVNMFLYKDQIRHYINTLFKFNKEFVEKYLIDLDDYEDGGRLVINLSILSNTSQVFASVALFLVIPHQPWYLFSYIYPKPWYWLIPGAIHEFVVVGQVISNYILYQWIMVAHSNSVEFWLKEIHNHNETGYTRETLRNPKTAIKTYRALQVLISCFNSCMSPLSIPLMKVHILTGLVPCGYVFIRSMNKVFIEEFPGILTYPICVIDCATAGFTTLALAAEVYDLSFGFVESWGKTRDKDFRRVLMSCPTLKMWIGRMYYVTVTTTITFFKVAVDFVTACIITFP